VLALRFGADGKPWRTNGAAGGRKTRFRHLRRSQRRLWRTAGGRNSALSRGLPKQLTYLAVCSRARAQTRAALSMARGARRRYLRVRQET